MDNIISRMRLFEQDHEPDGWPAVQMKDISALCDLAEAAKIRSNPDTTTGAPEHWKPVPYEPTQAMVDAAADAHMPFGDMDLAIRCAILAAPEAQK